MWIFLSWSLAILDADRQNAQLETSETASKEVLLCRISSDKVSVAVRVNTRMRARVRQLLHTLPSIPLAAVARR